MKRGLGAAERGLGAWLVAFSVSAAAAAAHGSQLVAPDAATRARLATSAVPVYLPDRLPAALGPVQSIQVIDAGPDGYYIAFSPVAACAGATSCAFFYVWGHRRVPRAPLATGGRNVPLPDGRTAVFRRPDCTGAGCTPASLTFSRAGATYELDAKVDRAALGVLMSAYRHLRRVARAGSAARRSVERRGSASR